MRACTAACEVVWNEAFWDREDRLKLMGRDEDEENLGHDGKTVNVRVDVWMR